MKGLLIEFDGGTGIRAGNLVLDDKLLCHGWQQLATVPCLEIRVIEDDRDVAQYEGIPGVTILHDDAEIQAAIDQYMPSRASVDNESLMKLDIEQRGILLKDVLGENTNEQLQYLKTQGVKGIVERKRPTLVEIYGPPETRAAKGLPE